MNLAQHEFTSQQLPDGHTVSTGLLPNELLPTAEQFEAIWALRPNEPQSILMYGRPVEIPRRQKAFLRDYTFSGIKAAAETSPLPTVLVSYIEWAQTAIDSRLNGLLLNWYDGMLGDYIGPHHDDTRQLVIGSSIVTISLGEQRIFRLTREEKRHGKKVLVNTRDLVAEPGSVIILPWETNLAWKHSVPRFARYRGRRVSITLRAFSITDASPTI